MKVPSPKEKLSILDTFPTAAEMAKSKKKEEQEKTLWQILNMFKSTEEFSILWTTPLSESCIKFLQDKGYSVKKDYLKKFTGEDEWCYDISCKQ